jgi:hypothetical protein
MMAIARPEPPKLIEEAAEASLEHVSRQASGKSATFIQKAQGSLRLSNPMLVFYLGLRSIIADSNLSAAKAIAWRFLVLVGSRVVASTEIALDKGDGRPYWSHVSYDPRAQTHFSVIKRVQRDPHYEMSRYEMRFLRISALDLNALMWLKATTDDKDVLIPMGSVAIVRPGWPYSVPKLFKTVERHAHRRLNSSSIPRNET